MAKVEGGYVKAGKIEKYEVMERETLGRLMLDMGHLLRLDDGWEPVGGIAVDYSFYVSDVTMSSSGTNYKYAMKKRYLQAVIKRMREPV